MRFSLFAAIAILILTMTNCSLGPALKDIDLAASLENLKAGGGGTGYDGKLAYINVDKENTCGPSPYSIRSVIEIGDDLIPRQVKKDCVDIAPEVLALGALGLQPHNTKNLRLGDRTYDLLSTETDPTGAVQNSTQYFCRGSGDDGDLDETHVADMILTHRLGAERAESAAVILAVYDKNGSFLRKLATGDLKIRPLSTGIPDRLKYESDYVGRYQVTLWIDKSGFPKTGKLTLIELPYEGKQLESGFRDEDYQKNVQNLICTLH